MTIYDSLYNFSDYVYNIFSLQKKESSLCKTQRIQNELNRNDSFKEFYDKVKKSFPLHKIEIIGGSIDQYPRLKGTDCYIEIRRTHPTIIYRDNLSDDDIKLSIIVELGNAYFAKDSLTLAAKYRSGGSSKAIYSQEIEHLEWKGLNKVKGLIKEIIPKESNPYSDKLLDDFNHYLKTQKKESHHVYF